MKQSKELLCVAITGNTGSSEALHVSLDIEHLRDAVIVNQSVYRNLFEDKAKNQRNYWIPQIVKVTFEGRSIYRRIVVSSTKGLDATKVGMTYNSIGELTNYSPKEANKIPIGEKVKVERGSRLTYWRRHPNAAARIAYIFGLSSIFIGLISVMLSLLLHFL